MIQKEGDTLRVLGSVTLRNARAVMAEAEPFLQGGDLKVDLSGVLEADSSALAVLLCWQRQAVARAGRLVVVSAPEGLRSIARTYGATALIPGLADDAESGRR